jgi:hypothetical protein
LVRQVRLELTIPCLRGRCLDPIWLLTHGGTERTRTVIDLIDNQVPHLSATVPNIADCQLPIADLCLVLRSFVSVFVAEYQSEIGNQKSAMIWDDLRSRTVISAFTVQRVNQLHQGHSKLLVASERLELSKVSLKN